MLSDLLPYSGCILVSEPFMLDENFIRSVILLLEHDDEGSFGLVLNNPIDKEKQKILNTHTVIKDQVYCGGPVELERITSLVRSKKVIEDFTLSFEKVHDNIFMLSGDYEFEEIGENMETRNFIGYTGWSAGQLEIEMQENSWIVIPLNAEFVFYKGDAKNLWKEVVESMDKRFRHIANFPKDPGLN